MKKSTALAICCLILMLPASRTFAQFDFNLSPSSVVSSAGSTLTFTGSLQNNSSEEMFLNGYTTSPIDTNLTLDDDKFFTNVPFSLQPGEQWTGGIFDILISSNALPEVFTISFTLLGGPDSNDQRDLATQAFQVAVVLPAADAVPEPRTGSAIIVPFLCLGILVCLKRLRRPSYLS